MSIYDDIFAAIKREPQTTSSLAKLIYGENSKYYRERVAQEISRGQRFRSVYVERSESRPVTYLRVVRR